MKFNAFVSEVWDGKIKWLWSVCPDEFPEDEIEGIAETLNDAKDSIYSSANAYRVGCNPLTEEWSFEL